MRLILLFDLPMLTKTDKRNYTRFRKALIKDGFSMIQFSAYMRFCKNAFDADKHITRVKGFAPNRGNIRILNVTEKQYEGMVLVIGSETPTEQYVNEQFTLVIE